MKLVPEKFKLNDNSYKSLYIYNSSFRLLERDSTKERMPGVI